MHLITKKQRVVIGYWLSMTLNKEVPVPVKKGFC